MKELSIEEKAKAYDKVSKEVKDFFEGRQKMYSDVTQTLEYLFPELKESEDERIRKEIIEYLKDERDAFPRERDDFQRWLAWLEKQNHDGKKWIYEDVYLKEKEQLIQDGIDEVLENPQKYGLEKKGEKTIPKDVDDAALQYVDTCTVDGEVTHDNITEPYWNNLSMMAAYKAGWIEKQCKKSEYDPYKATVESIAEMCKKYSTSSDLQDFYDNIKVKCKDAIEYDEVFEESYQPAAQECSEEEKQSEIDKTSYEIAEKEKYDFVNGQFIECRKSFDEFREDNSYWLEYIGNDTYIGRSDNILNKKFHITPRQLYRLFTQQHCPKEGRTADTIIDLVNEVKKAYKEYKTYGGLDWDTIIDWLKKCKQLNMFIESIRFGDKVTKNSNGELINLSQPDKHLVV